MKPDKSTRNLREAYMKINTLDAMVNSIVNTPNYHFSMLADLAKSLGANEAIDLLNDIVENKEIAGTYEVLSEDHIYVYRHPEFNLLLRFMGGDEPSSLYCNEFDAFIINPGEHKVEIPSYTCRLDRENVYKGPKGLVEGDRVTIPSGGIYFLQAYSAILDFSRATPADNFLLVAHSEKRGWITWIYDRRSLAPIAPICTDLTASRMQLYVRFLGELKALEAVQSLETLAKSAFAGFVRWEAVDALRKIAPERCMSLLKHLATHDIDPDIKQAASKSISINAHRREVA
jgi:hypothetical protein